MLVFSILLSFEMCIRFAIVAPKSFSLTMVITWTVFKQITRIYYRRGHSSCVHTIRRSLDLAMPITLNGSNAADYLPCTLSRSTWCFVGWQLESLMHMSILSSQAKTWSWIMSSDLYCFRCIPKTGSPRMTITQDDHMHMLPKQRFQAHHSILNSSLKSCNNISKYTHWNTPGHAPPNKSQLAGIQTITTRYYQDLVYLKSCSRMTPANARAKAAMEHEASVIVKGLQLLGQIPKSGSI